MYKAYTDHCVSRVVSINSKQLISLLMIHRFSPKRGEEIIGYECSETETQDLLRTLMEIWSHKVAQMDHGIKTTLCIFTDHKQNFAFHCYQQKEIGFHNTNCEGNQ